MSELSPPRVSARFTMLEPKGPIDPPDETGPVGEAVVVPAVCVVPEPNPAVPPNGRTPDSVSPGVRQP